MKHLIITALAAAVGLGHPQSAQQTTPPIRIAQAIQAVESQTKSRQTSPKQDNGRIRSSSSLPGIVEPIRDAVMVMPMTGMLMQINVREGQSVESTSILAVVDNRVAAANEKIARFDAESTSLVDVANVELKVAMAELRRLQNVRDRRAIAAIELDRAKANVERAQVEVQRAKEARKRAGHELSLQKAQLETLNLRAPFTSKVLSVDVQKGQSISVGTPVLRVADLSTLRVHLFIGVEFFGRLKVDEVYQLKAAAPVNRTIDAKLTAFEPVINAATNTFRCSFEIQNPNEQLPAGFKVTFTGLQTAQAATSIR